MWIHCPRWDIPRAVAKIRKDRSKAVLVVPMGSTEEESTRHWVVSLTNMTLNKVVLPAGESVYQDAKGQPMPPQRWPTDSTMWIRALIRPTPRISCVSTAS